jgi:UDP-3-O-[3-hydroxymyristoyl] glucosamine N-acyltransferase
MILNSSILNQVLDRNISSDIFFENIGLANTQLPNSLTFIDDLKYLNELSQNKNVKGVLTTKEIAGAISDDFIKIISEDPRWDYYTIYNHKAKSLYQEVPSQISPSAQIHHTAFVSEWNVVIGDRSIIGPNVSILSDVEIGQNTIVRAGTVIGTEGFEYKRTTKGILPVFHDGKVIIGNKVDIGALNAIAKGFSFRNTIIDDETKTDNLVHIAHCAYIGKRCLLPASSMIAGSVTIKDDAWIGPNASVSSGITIGENSFITIGSVVVRSVADNQKVTGNFAIPHQIFLNNLKDSLKKK